MSFLYPRMISVMRPNKQTGEGVLPPGGATVASEALIASDIPASIQLRREGSKDQVGLPGGALAPFWDVLIPRGSAALGLIESKDIVVDDTAERYQVVANYWDSLGYKLRCQKLED